MSSRSPTAWRRDWTVASTSGPKRPHRPAFLTKEGLSTSPPGPQSASSTPPTSPRILGRNLANTYQGRTAPEWRPRRTVALHVHRRPVSGRPENEIPRPIEGERPRPCRGRRSYGIAVAGWWSFPVSFRYVIRFPDDANHSAAEAIPVRPESLVEPGTPVRPPEWALQQAPEVLHAVRVHVLDGMVDDLVGVQLVENARSTPVHRNTARTRPRPRP